MDSRKGAIVFLSVMWTILLTCDIGGGLTIAHWPQYVELNILFGLSLFFANMACLTASIYIWGLATGKEWA